MTRILTVTLNPALDITTSVDQLVDGKKLRCEEPRFDPGGGGVNVSRAIDKLARTSTLFVAVGGPTGEFFRSLLKRENLTADWFDIEGNTRQSFAVDDRNADKMYRFSLPGPKWSLAEWQGSLYRVEDVLKAGDYLVVSGSLPPGVSNDYAIQLAQRASKAGARMIVDTSGLALDTIAHRGPTEIYALTMDEDEARQLIGSKVLIEERDAVELARDLLDRGVAKIVVVTLGSRGAVALTSEEGWRVAPPKVQVVSKVGAGDSFVAGFTIGLAEQWPLNRTVAYAMASATSAVTTAATELCTKEGTERFVPAVSSKPL